MLFTDFYLGLGRVFKTLFILNTFLGSYIFQYFEAVGWKHLYNVPVLEGFQPHDIWQRQRNPSTARIVFRLVWRRAPPSCMGPLIWSGYHEKAFTKPKNQAKNLKDSKSGLRFFFFFVCFILLLGGWLRSLYKNQTEILCQSRHFIFVLNKLLRKYIMLQHISTDDLIIRILFSIRINSFWLVDYAFKTYILIKICLKIIDSILMRLFDAPARKKQR